MKKIVLLALAVISVVSSFCQKTDNFSAITAHNIEIKLFPNKAENIIPKEIYGQFAEHLGRCIYGGIWVGKDSPIPNIDGYRKDVVEALKALEVPVIRWPGGCFADEYHWMDGVGPLENRPRMVNSNWGGTVEDNSFGTHEFLNLCEILGCDAYISGNVGTGSPEELQKWVEYMTSDTNSTMAEMRRKNGREKPWYVKYLGIGNEAWGCGGEMEPEFYSMLYRQFAHFSGGGAFKVASGGNAVDYNWTKVLMQKIGKERMNGISLHYYAVTDWGTNPDGSGRKGSSTNYSREEYYRTLIQSLAIDDCIQNHIKEMDKADPENKVALMVDEWGTWWNPEPGTNPGWLYNQSTMRDAIVASTSLDIFQKYVHRVKMTNIAQMVNVLQAMILTDEKNPASPCLLTPTYYVYKMYKVHKENKFVPGKIETDWVHLSDGKGVPFVSYTASRKDDGTIYLSLTNMDYDNEHLVSVALDGKNIKTAKGEILTSNDIHAYNDFGRQEIENREFKKFTISKNNITLSLPAHSIVTIALNVK